MSKQIEDRDIKSLRDIAARIGSFLDARKPEDRRILAAGINAILDRIEAKERSE